MGAGEMEGTEAGAVFAASERLYREVALLAHGAPGWLREAAEAGTDLLLLGFALLFLAGWWRARGEGAGVMAAALLAPAVTTVAYAVSRSLKGVFEQERPCSVVADVAAAIASCPPPGDWSFPSNHAAVAGAAAVAVVLVRGAWALVAAPLALLEAFSRVFVGVHYPHDVLAGLVVGALVAAVAVPLARGPVGAAVVHLRERSALRPLLAVPPADPLALPVKEA